MSIINGRGVMAGGGGGKLLHSVTLPKSVYYKQAALWSDVASPTLTTPCAVQVFLNDAIYAMEPGNGNNIVKMISPTTGLILDTFTVQPGIPYGTVAITDGAHRIWLACTGASVVWEIDVLTKTSKMITSLPNVSGIGYSKYHNALFCFGWNYLWNGAGTPYAHRYDLGAGTATNMAPPLPIAYGSCYCVWCDDETGLVHYAFNGAHGTPDTPTTVCDIYYYNPTTNSYSLVKSSVTFPGTYLKAAGHLFSYSYVAVKNVVKIFTKNTSATYDFKTLTFVEEPISTPRINNTYLTNSSVCFDPVTDTLYCVNSSALQACELFSTLPEDAPIVCKIYKGQKYHALKPVEIKSQGFTIGTTQQVADRDITIRLYEYGSGTENIIYIET